MTNHMQCYNVTVARQCLKDIIASRLPYKDSVVLKWMCS